MKAPRLLIVTIAAIAALLVSCADSRSVATVNGESILFSEVIALRASSGDGATLDSQAFRDDLTPLIFLEAQLHAAEEDFGLTDLDAPERIDDKLANPTADERGLLDGVAGDPERTEATLRVVAAQLIVRQAVAAALLESDPAYLRDLYENEPAAVTSVCARHILTLTREEIDDARERIAGGEDFAAVAEDVSIDTTTSGSGGELGCPVPANRYPEPFTSTVVSLPLGEVSEPLQTDLGWHIVRVDERTGPASVDELVADPLVYVDSQIVADRWGAWLDDAVARADIEVASQVGRWFPEGDGILPPS